MKEQLQKLVKKIDAMTLRERVITFVMSALILVYLVNALVINPLFIQQKKLASQIKSDQTQAAELRLQIDQKIRAHSEDPDAINRARLRELTAQYEKVQSGLLEMQKGLIPPERMATLLEDILRRNGKLRLVSLRTLPVTGLSEAVNADSKTLEEKAPTAKSATSPAATAVAMATPTTVPPAAVQALTNPGSVVTGKEKSMAPSAEDHIYRHGVEITVQGSYLDMLNYMAELEAMPWQIFWSKAKLSVDEYPKTTLTLTLFTLSLDKKWMNL